MAGTHLEVAKKEAARLTEQIGLLEETIRRHVDSCGAWSTIERNAGDDSQTVWAAGLNPAAQIERLSEEIELLQEAIRKHTETSGAWNTILRNANEDDAELVWASGSEPSAQIDRLTGEIELLHRTIDRYAETRDAWETILRNGTSEVRIVWGADAESEQTLSSAVAEEPAQAAAIPMVREAAVSTLPDNVHALQQDSPARVDGKELPVEDAFARDPFFTNDAQEQPPATHLPPANVPAFQGGIAGLPEGVSVWNFDTIKDTINAYGKSFAPGQFWKRLGGATRKDEQFQGLGLG
jgi:hypothetical protein